MNPVRKLKLTSREEGRKPTNSDKVLGKGAKKGLLMSRACPNFDSPKRRGEPMEVDEGTPGKRSRKSAKTDPNQQLITDVWCLKKRDQN